MGKMKIERRFKKENKQDYEEIELRNEKREIKNKDG